MLEEKGYTVDVRESESLPTQEEINEALSKKPYDAVITLLTDKIDAVIFDANPTIKLYANYAIGFDNIDVSEAKKRGICATNTPGAYADCIAEHTIGLILNLTARIAEGDRFVRAGLYKGWSPTLLVGTDLSGKTLGLIGAGRIGERVAYHLNKGFDVKVLYYDVVRNEKIEKECGATYLATVEEVLQQADIVSIHTPLLPTTKHLINEERLNMMKPTSFLINTARGPVVDEHALLKALQEGRIRGAGLDVLEFEPNPVAGLSDLPNVVITPHIASARESARNEMANIVAENVIDFFEGRTPRNNVVN